MDGLGLLQEETGLSRRFQTPEGGPNVWGYTRPTLTSSACTDAHS